MILEYISANHTLSETRFSELNFCHRQAGSYFIHLDVIGPKAPEFGEIMQNNGHYAIQDHS